MEPDCWSSTDLHGDVVGSQHSHAGEAAAHGGRAGRQPGRADQGGPLHGCNHPRVHIHPHTALLPAPLGPLDSVYKRCCPIPLHLQDRQGVSWSPYCTLVAVQFYPHSATHPTALRPVDRGSRMLLCHPSWSLALLVAGLAFGW